MPNRKLVCRQGTEKGTVMTKYDSDAGTTTKADLIQAVYELDSFTKRESADLVSLIFDTLKEQLEAGTKVKISGFGNFEVKEKNSRPGRNPQTGEEIMIDERRILKFKPSQILKDNLNANRGDG